MQHIPGLSEFTSGAISRVVHHKETTHTQIVTAVEQQGRTSAPEHPVVRAQSITSVNEPLLQENSAPTVPPQSKSSTSKKESSRGKASSEPNEPAPKPKTKAASQKASPTKKATQPKPPKVTKEKKTKESPAPTRTTPPVPNLPLPQRTLLHHPLPPLLQAHLPHPPKSPQRNAREKTQ